MSRSWTLAELQKASALMKAAGHMSFEEFCEWFDKQCPSGLQGATQGKSSIDIKLQVDAESGVQR